MAKLRIESTNTTDTKPRYLDLDIHRQNKKLRKLLLGISCLSILSVGLNFFLYF